jgi:hypothetical protein
VHRYKIRREVARLKWTDINEKNMTISKTTQKRIQTAEQSEFLRRLDGYVSTEEI